MRNYVRAAVTIAAAATAVLALTAVPAAARAPVATPHAPLAGPAQAECAAPTKGHMACMAFRRTDVAHPHGVQPATAPFGYAPADLAGAYDLPTGGGAGETVAITIAYDNPNLESDLAVYRQQSRTLR